MYTNDFKELIMSSCLLPDDPENIKSIINSKRSLSNINRIIFPNEITITGDDIIITKQPIEANDSHPHYHDFFELMYMYKGSCKHIVNDQELSLNEGDICILGLSDAHYALIESSDDILINVLIKKSLFDKSFLSLISENDLLSNFFVTSLFETSSNNSFLFFPYDSNSSATHLLQQLISEYISKKVCYKKSIECYLALLFSELLRTYQSKIDKENFNSMGNNNLSDILMYINTNKSSVTLTSVAEHFHYNPNYLSALIKKYTNKSFSDILQQIKLEEACHYLAYSDMSIDDIVQVLGYYDKSYFYKIFKRKYSLTPAQYRLNNNCSEKKDS